jgi:hypothetical protein
MGGFKIISFAVGFAWGWIWGDISPWGPKDIRFWAVFLGGIALLALITTGVESMVGA